VPTHRHDFEFVVQKQMHASMKSFFLLLFTLLSACLTSLSRPTEKRTPRIRAVTRRRSQQGIAEQSVNSSRGADRSLYFLPSVRASNNHAFAKVGRFASMFACSQRCSSWRFSSSNRKFAWCWEYATMLCRSFWDGSAISQAH
jgi:hypothetical protein